MKNDAIISGNITPTDVKIYMEDGCPYLDYTGKCFDTCGNTYTVHFPKVGLTLTNIETQKKSEYDYMYTGRKIRSSLQVFAKNDEFFSFEVVKREVSKKQLEKEFGYKLDIKE